jgi:hypothetical protein
MSEILNVKSQALADDSITGIQFHSYNSYTTAFNNNDEIRISVQQQDLYVFPHDSFIYVEGTVTRTIGADADADVQPPNFVSNFGAFLFEEIRYELNGFEIDRCKNVGVTSNMKGYTSFNVNDMNLLKIAGWKVENQAIPCTFSCCIPLNTLLGFAEDYQKILMNAKHEIILVRSRNDTNCFVGVNDVMKINIQKIQWKIPHVHVSDAAKLMLLKYVERKQPIPMSFRSWELYEYPTLPQTDRHIWAVKTANQLSKPRYIILGFQTNRKNVITRNASHFDHCNISDVKVHLNSECYPYENLNLNFGDNHFTQLYNMYAKFQKSYYHNRQVTSPLLTLEEFGAMAPLFVIDCSRQNETLKHSMVDIKIEIQARENIPANTSAYCLIIHDSLISYNPYTNVVNKAV